MNSNHFDAVVVGAGFYGSIISVYLKKNKGLNKILLLEKDSEIMKRSSSNNQARIHNGYHYPRSFLTASRSHANFSRFIDDWSLSVKKEFINIYAIARNNSKISGYQFKKFCNKVNIPIKEANQSIKKKFNKSLVSDIFLTEEYVFDTNTLKQLVLNIIKKNNINLELNTTFNKILKKNNKKIISEILFKEKKINISSDFIFNCTYSSLNQINEKMFQTKNQLKHEITEIALIKPPIALNNMGITIMDGPFFSILPFPKKKLHSISHVKYTPHYEWLDNPHINPEAVLNNFLKKTNINKIIRDASRYLPVVKDSKYIESFFEVKTILTKNDNDDGRPILFEESKSITGLYSILGGKLDNIYDILTKIDELFSK